MKTSDPRWQTEIVVHWHVGLRIDTHPKCPKWALYPWAAKLLSTLLRLADRMK